MVAIAQLAEHRIVVPSVVGSSPTSHPKETLYTASFFVTSGLARTQYEGPPKKREVVDLSCDVYWWLLCSCAVRWASTWARISCHALSA